MSTFTIIAIVGGVILVILLIVGVVISSSSDRRLVEDRLGQYLDEGAKQDEKKQKEDTALSEWVSKRVAKTSFGDRVARDLARADLKLKIAEYFALMAIAAIGLGGVLWFFGDIPGLIFGMGVGFAAPGIYVKQQQKARLKKFNDQLGDMLNLMVNGLRAGYSTMQAVEAVSKELPPPICDEFRRVVQEMQIGIPMETALENLLRRIPSPDLDFVVTAINVQREVGGNLSEILDTISFTIRERVRIKGEINVLTSQVRASGTLLSLLPLCLTVLIYFVNRNYIMEIANAGTVCLIIVVSVVLFLLGTSYAIMMNIANIEV